MRLTDRLACRLSPRRSGVLACLVVAAVAGVASYVLAARSPGSPVVVRPEVSSAGLKAIPVGGRLLVRTVDVRDPTADGHVFELTRSGASMLDGLRCTRLHAGAHGGGLCMGESADGSYYEATVFDLEDGERAGAPIVGIPSRARTSPDGRYAAYTAFMDGGEGYVADPSLFSTDTRILDLASGRVLLDLDDLAIQRDGRLVEGPDRELWGVTFGNGGRFYATVADDTERLLIAGRVGSRHADVVGERVECPSLSPDGSRIAYKRPLRDGSAWRLHVLDLVTGRDVQLAERRSIDDQPEWLGDRQIVYSDSNAVFAVPADGSGRPVLIAGGAGSPAYVR